MPQFHPIPTTRTTTTKAPPKEEEEEEKEQVVEMSPLNITPTTTRSSSTTQLQESSPLFVLASTTDRHDDDDDEQEQWHNEKNVSHDHGETYPQEQMQHQHQHYHYHHQQLDPTLKLLFGLGGATLQLPSLALLAIVNDRVAIPPAYLPAYGAISFLPHSLKPLYALLSISRTDDDDDNNNNNSNNNNTSTSFLSTEEEEEEEEDYDAQQQQQQHKTGLLLAVLLAASGMAYLGTAWFIPVGGVLSCFAWAFLRGITSAWSQFLLNQCLIQQASSLSSSSSSTSCSASSASSLLSSSSSSTTATATTTTRATTTTTNTSTTYQQLSSLFQSQAMTCSNLGSLVVSIGTLGVFLWRQSNVSKEKPLSETFVMALLVATALLNFVGSLLVLFQWIRRPTTTSRYDVLSTTEERLDHNLDNSSSSAYNNNINVHGSSSSSTANDYNTGSTDVPPLTVNARREQQQQHQLQSQSQWTLQDRSDVATLALLQIILIGAALRRPIVAAVNKQTIWTVPMVILGICLIGSLVVSSCYQGHTAAPSTTTTATTATTTSDHKHYAIPPRRLGIYLILRHAVPISSILMYHYIYNVLERQPLFLQFLLVAESTASVGANWFYGRFLSLKYYSGWGIIGLTAALSILASLVSLLDVIVFHKANEKFHCDDGDDGTTCYFHVDSSLRWLILVVSLAAYFMGQIGYMPSVVLSTANVVPNSSSVSLKAPSETTTTSSPGLSQQSETIGSSLGESINDDDATGVRKSHYDEGVQFATFNSCIDFGAQMGDWISIPIITAYGISRENNWTNLDHWIALCALLRIASCAFLCIIRPPPRDD